MKPFREQSGSDARLYSIDFVRTMFESSNYTPSNRKRHTALRRRLRRMREFLPVAIAFALAALVIAFIMLWAANL